MTSSLCINCGNEVATAYCSTCGQKNPPKKISLLNLYTDFQSRVYGFDGMFPQTIRDLTVRPGKVALAYISGNRVKYVGPVGYFFVMLTVFIVLLNLLGIEFYEFGQANNPFAEIQPKQGQEELTQILLKVISDNLRIFNFLLIPLTAIWFKVFFRKSGYTFFEMTVPACYFYGHLEILAILNVIIFWLFETSINGIIFPFYFIYFGFASITMFGSGVKIFLKGVLVYLFAFILYALAISIFSIVYAITHPEILEKMRPT